MKIIRMGVAIALVLLAAAGGAKAAVEPQTSEVTAAAAFLIDVTTGKTLYDKNADEPLPPASTTKILTALLLLELAELSDVVLVGTEIKLVGPGSSIAGLKEGDRLTVAELIYALLLPSGNDAAYTAAVFGGRRLSGFEQMEAEAAVAVFVGQMNRRATELGAVNSYFVVPDGYDTPGHVSTARDLATIALAACQQPFICQVAATPIYHWQGKSWTNTNSLLLQDCPKAYYPWATGLKTGYTGKAGHCLVATAKGGARELVAVILKSNKEKRWQDIRWLLEFGFSGWKDYKMFTAGRQVFILPVYDFFGREQLVEIIAAEDWADLLSIEQVSSLKLDYRWQPGVVDNNRKGLALKAPLSKGQVVGSAIISLEGEILGEVSLVAIAGAGYSCYWLLLISITLVFIAGVYVFRRKKQRPAKVDNNR